MKSAMLSIVVPVHNEQLVLAELARRCLAAGEAAASRLELILVDDASSDRTPGIMAELAADPRVRPFRLETCQGQFGATKAGLRLVRGDWAVVLDGDLQDPPEKIADLAQAMPQDQDGRTVVYAIKTKRGDPAWFRFGNAAYRLIVRSIGGDLPDGAGSYCLMSGTMASEAAGVPLRTANLAAVLSALGARAVTVPYEKLERYDGSSRVGMAGLIREALSSIYVISPFGRRLLRGRPAPGNP